MSQYASVQFHCIEGQSKVCQFDSRSVFQSRIQATKYLLQSIYSSTRNIYPNNELYRREFLYDKCVKNLDNIVSLLCPKTVSQLDNSVFRCFSQESVRTSCLIRFKILESMVKINLSDPLI